MPSFKCRDLGMDCPFEASALTEPDLMKKISEHVKEAHDMKEISGDMMAKIKKVIKQ